MLSPTFDRRATVVEEGGAYLPKIDVKVLEEMQRREPFGKAKFILQAAVLRKRGKTYEDIEDCIGIPVGTVHGWLARLALGDWSADTTRRVRAGPRI